MSEVAIKRYELGIKNQPDQLEKIAQAVNVGENILLDIPFKKQTIEIVGDAIVLYFLIKSRIGIECICRPFKAG